jgi:hypothetical protein
MQSSTETRKKPFARKTVIVGSRTGGLGQPSNGQRGVCALLVTFVKRIVLRRADSKVGYPVASRVNQSLAQVGSDEPGTSGDQYLHECHLSLPPAGRLNVLIGAAASYFVESLSST